MTGDLWDGFEGYLAYLDIEKESADSTVVTREQDLRQACRWLKRERGCSSADDVSRLDIAKYVDYLVEEGYAFNTIFRSSWPSLSAAFNHLDTEGMIDENPIDGIERQAIKSKAQRARDSSEQKGGGPKEHLSKSEVYELANNTPGPADRNELLIKLMFWTGVRVSEIVTIEIGDDGTLDGPGSDINTKKPEIRFYSEKADEVHYASYPRDEINPLLRDWVRNGRLRYKRATQTNRLFVGRKGALSASRITDIIKDAAENAGIQKKLSETIDGRQVHKITPHILRHSFAMYYHNEEDVPLGKIKTALNHSSVETTESFYAETTREEIVETFGR